MQKRPFCSATGAVAAVWIAGCLALAFRGEEPAFPLLNLTNGPRTLYENSTFGQRVDVSRSGTVPLHVVARGRAVDGTYPYLALRVDGEFRTGFFVPSESWGLYRVLLELPRGRHTLQWSYVNDATHYPQARDLDLLALTFDAPPSGAQDPHRWRAPCRLEPARMAHRAFGDSEPDGYHLWPGGSLADDVYIAAAGRYAVHVEASPSGAAALDFRVDGTSVETTWLDLGPGLHRLEWVRRASARGAPPADELIVRAITVGEVAVQEAERRGPLQLSGETTALRASAFASRPAGDEHQGVFALWSNGYLSQPVTTRETRSFWLTVRARGDACDGEGPRLVVMAGRDQLALLEVAATELTDYELPLTLDAGRHEITLVYDNDEVPGGRCDRNLYVDRIVFDPQLPATRPGRS